MVAQKSQDLLTILGPGSKLESLLGKCVAVLVALGLADSQIAQILAEPIVRIEILKQSTEVVDTIIEIQSALTLSSEQRIANAVNSAIDYKLRLMHATSDEKLKDKIASDFMDRHFGKATQMVQTVVANITTNASASDLDNKIDAAMARIATLNARKDKLLSAKNVTPIPATLTNG